MYAKTITKKAERTLTPHRDFVDLSDNDWDNSFYKLVNNLKGFGVNTIEHPIATGAGATAGGLYGLLGRDHMADSVRKTIDKATSGGSFDPLKSILRQARGPVVQPAGLSTFGGTLNNPNSLKRLIESLGRFGKGVGNNPYAIPRALQETVSRGADSGMVRSLSQFFRTGTVPGFRSTAKLRGRVGTTAAALGAILGAVGAHKVSNLGD